MRRSRRGESSAPERVTVSREVRTSSKKSRTRELSELEERSLAPVRRGLRRVGSAGQRARGERDELRDSKDLCVDL